MRRTLIILGTLLLAILLVLGACAPATAPIPEETPPEPEETAPVPEETVPESEEAVQTLEEEEVELKYDNGIADTLNFAGPNGGHLIHFSPLGVPFDVKKVKVFGVVVGTGWEGRDFEVQIWDKSHKVLWSKNYPFTLFPVGDFKTGTEWRKTIDWVELEVPDIEVTDEFYIHIWTNDSCLRPEPRGIGIGTDLSSINKHCEGTLGYEIKWMYPSSKERANWMIRVVGTAMLPPD